MGWTEYIGGEIEICVKVIGVTWKRKQLYKSCHVGVLKIITKK